MPPRPASSSPPYLQDVTLRSIKLSHLSDIDVTDRIPGYRTSAAFFASLKANLRLSESSPTPLPSPVPAPLRAHGRPTNHVAAADAKPEPAPSTLHLPSPLIRPNTIKSPQHVKSQLSSQQHSTPASTTLSKPQPRPRSNSHLASSVATRPTVANEPPPDQQQLPLLYWTTSAQDTSSALSLIASTVSEQKHLAFRTLLLHPLHIILFILLLFIVQKSMFCVARYTSMKNRGRAFAAKYGPGDDAASWAEVAVVWAGITFTCLATAQIVTWPYLRLARRITAGGADGGGGGAGSTARGANNSAPEKEDAAGGQSAAVEAWYKSTRDEILVAVVTESSPADLTIRGGAAASGGSDMATEQCTDERELIVGALIMTFVPGAAGGKTNKRRRSSGGRGYVRAWAVSPSWRGKGIGGSLLDEAARVTVKERGGDCVCFAEGHAYAERVLPDFYNGPFDRRDRRAQLALLRSVETRPWTLNRRR